MLPRHGSEGSHSPTRKGDHVQQLGSFGFHYPTGRDISNTHDYAYAAMEAMVYSPNGHTGGSNPALLTGLLLLFRSNPR